MSIRAWLWDWVTEGRRAETEAEMARRAAQEALRDASEQLKQQARTPLDDIACPVNGTRLNGRRHDLDSD